MKSHKRVYAFFFLFIFAYLVFGQAGYRAAKAGDSFVFSFETGMEGWVATGTDLEPTIPWSITRTTDMAINGETSLKFILTNLNDAGKIWIERPFYLKPDMLYHVNVKYDFASGDCANCVNQFVIITGVAQRRPETRDDLTFQENTGNGSEPIGYYVWLGKNYDFTLRSGAGGILYVFIGIWGVWEVTRIYYVDNVRITFSELWVDVPLEYWAFDFITAIYNDGITKGCSENPLRYCPTNPVTREQIAAFIIRVLEGDPATPCVQPPFSDVPIDNFFCKHIERMRDLGIDPGYEDGRYGPLDMITREQIAAFLVRAKDRADPPEDSCAEGSPFTDVSPDSWSCKYIKRLHELRITKGCGDGIYCPSDTVNRAQMAVFLWRFYQPAFQTSLTLKDANNAVRNEFSAGEDITLEFKVTNLLNSPQTLTLPSSQRYDFIVAGDPGTLWNWSHDKGFALVITELRFGPLETKVFREVWNQMDKSGVQVLAGTYQAQGFIATDRETRKLFLTPESGTRSPVVTFTIR
jgi:hypothetical protein